MKTNANMNDDQRKAAWATVTEPLEALEELSAHSEFVGSDPYYRDLNDALWSMVDRVLSTSATLGASAQNERTLSTDTTTTAHMRPVDETPEAAQNKESPRESS